MLAKIFSFGLDLLAFVFPISLAATNIIFFPLSSLWLIGASIAPYSHGGIYNHEERRDRKLLMHAREIRRLKTDVFDKGLTAIALALYLKDGHVKIKIAKARGKKHHDRRRDIKDRDEDRRIKRAIRRES